MWCWDGEGEGEGDERDGDLMGMSVFPMGQNLPTQDGDSECLMSLEEVDTLMDGMSHEKVAEQAQGQRREQERVGEE